MITNEYSQNSEAFGNDNKDITEIMEDLDVGDNKLVDGIGVSA